MAGCRERRLCTHHIPLLGSGGTFLPGRGLWWQSESFALVGSGARVQGSLGLAALLRVAVLSLPSPGISLLGLIPLSHFPFALFTPEALRDDLQPLQKTKLNGFSWTSDQCPRSADPGISRE